jgi:hypothetical protein
MSEPLGTYNVLTVRLAVWLDLVGWFSQLVNLAEIE